MMMDDAEIYRLDDDHDGWRWWWMIIGDDDEGLRWWMMLILDDDNDDEGW